MTKKRKALIITLVVILSVGIIFASVFLGLYFAKDSGYKDFRVLAYVTEESVLDADSLEEFDFAHTTDIIYAFARVDSTLLPVMTDTAKQGLRTLSDYLSANFPDVKLTLSVGGGGIGDDFCDMSRTKKTRTAFAQGLKSIADEYDLDGFDIDWEFPGKANDNGMKYCKHCTADHAELLSDMREVLGKDAILSIAVSGGIGYVPMLKNFKLAKVLNYVNVMNYDFSLTKQASFSMSKTTTFNCYLAGYKKTQLFFGVPFYGRSETESKDYMSYKDIMNRIEAGTATLTQKCDYSYAMVDGAKLSFDTAAMVRKKMQWVKQRGYGGGFCWHMGCDKNSELINVMWDELRS